MLQKKLQALGHPYPHLVDLENRLIFASTVIWLEDQQIRRYKIKDRINLRKIDDSQVWEAAYEQYKTDIGMPHLSSSFEEMSWLLNYSMSLDDDDDVIVLSSSSEMCDQPDPLNDAFLETDWHRIPNPFAKIERTKKRKKKISGVKKKEKNDKEKLKVAKFMGILKAGGNSSLCPSLISIVKHNSSPRIVSLPKSANKEACPPYSRIANANDTPQHTEAPIKLPENRPDENIEVVVYNFSHKEGCILRAKREKFKKVFHDALDAFLKANSNRPLKFTNANFKSGRYHVTCGDEYSADCLTKLIDGLTNWENTKLGVIPVPYWLRLTRVTVWIPGALEKPAVLLKRIEQQNCHVNTKDWKIYHTRPYEGLGQLLVLGIDEESFKSLISFGRKVQCGFNQVKFKIVPSRKD